MTTSTTTIDIDRLEAALQRGVLVVDVREAAEYAEAHVPGAVNIPMGQLPGRLHVLADLGPVHLICQGGGRSSAMVPVVAAAGLEALDVAGGTAAWIRAGKPTESGAR